MFPSSHIVHDLRARIGGLMAIYAHGSRVIGNHRPDSDLDIAVLVEGYADKIELWEAASDLALTLGYDIDLMDFRGAPAAMQAQILVHGKRLWYRDEQVGLYEAAVLTMWCDWNERNEDLIRDIRKKGRVYGQFYHPE